MALRVSAKPYFALAVALSGLACTAEIIDGGKLGGGAGPGGGLGNSGGSSGSGGATSTPLDCKAPVAPRAPLRRLTRFEYNNTLADLLGDTSSPANAFPSEELGNGFGNDADAQSVSSLLAEQYANVAEAVAARATDPAAIAQLAPCTTTVTDTASELACARAFVEAWVPLAYRRALAAGEADGLLELFQLVRAASDFPSSIGALVEAVLQGPQLLYKAELGVPEPGRADLMRPTGDEMATRLSYFLWGTMPDAGLRAAAAAGELSTQEGVLTQATRLLGDARSRPVVRFFFDNLLPIASLSSLERDEALYPSFNAKVGSLMRTESELFLEHQIFDGPGTWPSVFTADYTFVNQELAAFYGMAGVTGEEFRQVPLDTTKRMGLLTQAGMVAGTVHSNMTNPVVRGSFIVQKLLCRPIPLPTGDILAQVKPPDPYSGATARERFSAHSEQLVCKSCHISMDPIGFGLENFDAVGAWRDAENGVTIDASGEMDLLGTFNGPVELAQRIAESEAAQTCFASNWLSFAYGRTLKSDEDGCTIQTTQNAFKESGYNVKQLLLQLTQTDAFLYLPAVRE